MANCNLTAKVTGPSSENADLCIVGMSLFATNAPQAIVDRYVKIIKDALEGMNKPPLTLEVTGTADGTDAININLPVSIAQASVFEVRTFDGLAEQAAENNA